MKPFFASLILLITASALGQSLTSQQKTSIDSLFVNWDSQKKPGIAVAIVRNGNEIYSKTVGMSDVSTGIKADEHTPFWIASVSKQFTAMGITTLEQKGALSVNDPISKYLPELSHLPHIQIKHLLHHTSGLRDGFTLVGMTLKGEKHYDPKSVFEMIKKQTALNFQPGTRHEYVNSNYVLLALIAERVSKMQFADFMQLEVFSKLEMSDSRIFNDDAKGADAKGHYNAGGKYKKNKRFIPAFGSTGVMLSLRDAIKLEQNFQRGNPFIPIDTLLQGDGVVPHLQSYKRGLEHYQLKGYEVVSHFGSDPGFRADIVRIPKQKLSIIIFSNAGDYWDLSMNMFDVAGIVLSDNELKTIWHSDNELKSQPEISSKLQGVYLDTVSGSTTRFVKYENSVLKSSSTMHGYYAPLKHDEGGKYSKQDNYETTYNFASNGLTVDRADGTLNLIKIDSASLNLRSQPSELKGRYYSPELKKTYRITTKKNTLRLSFFHIMHSPLTSLGKDMYYAEFFGGNVLRFERETDGSLSMLFSREGIKDLNFIKR